mmetsp:Transcript_42889/g.79998  ORF Transcript_42889/g.79998 Transcript_42889/m.79998 type:complete len:406 (+) Transcript_42889:42-1259(+)
MCGSDQPSGSTYQTQACFKPVKKAEAKPGDLVVEEFPITFDGYTYSHGRIAWIMGREPAPVILVHHNYAGLKQFDIDQASYLAKVGYVGLAVDLYKETAAFTYEDRARTSGRPVDFQGFCAAAHDENPLERSPAKYSDEELKALFEFAPKDDSGKVHWQLVRSFLGAFRQMNSLLKAPGKWRELMKAFLEKAFEHPAVRSGLAGAIGYCLGGQSCLEQVRAGHQVQAICSLHGLLHSRPTTDAEPFNSLKRMSREDYAQHLAVPNTYNTATRVLIQNGAHDAEVPFDTIADFMDEMDAQGIDWRFENHARGPHGFALPKGSPGGDHYTEVIDRRSTLAMLSLFAEAWPSFAQFPVAINAAGCKLGQRIVPDGAPAGPVGDRGQRRDFYFGALLGALLMALLRARL